MNDTGRRVNSIIIKNLPTNYTENQLEELFSKFGRIVSSKVLPTNPNFDGGCGFVNYADADSCNKAVENMNNFAIDRFTLRVNHSASRMNNTPNGFNRVNGESTDENNGTLSPGTQNRFNGFRPASTRSPTCTTPSKTNESETVIPNNKPLWNSTNIEQQINKSPLQNEAILNIREHDTFVTNKNDYVNATLLITQMNKHEQLTKVQANAYKIKLVIGQCCAALFNGDWYRARILETEENRVRVQYIDWGNTGWCDSILEIRPLPNEYYKDSTLCVKCLLDDVSSEEKLADEQTNAILEILVLDVKLEMIVLRIENGIPYVQLNLGERNLNMEIRALLSQPSVVTEKSDEKLIDFDSNKPEMNISEIHSVQLTTVDTDPECFHVLLMRDCLPTIMNVLKDWNANKQPLTNQPKANMLVCAQYEGDDLWYRAWIRNVTDSRYRVYFVDFGNEEVVSSTRLTECPEILRNIPWQSVQIKLANIQLADDERYLLLRDYETEKLEMKILAKNQEIYSVELINNGKSLTEYMFQVRQNKEQQSAITNEVIPKEIVQPALPKPVTPPVEPAPQVLNENVRPTSLPINNEPKRSVEKILPPPPTANVTKPAVVLGTTPKPLSSNEQNNDSNYNDNLTATITEQRRQNRLLEQVIAAINTTNALLTPTCSTLKEKNK